MSWLTRAGMNVIGYGLCITGIGISALLVGFAVVYVIATILLPTGSIVNWEFVVTCIGWAIAAGVLGVFSLFISPYAVAWAARENKKKADAKQAAIDDAIIAKHNRERAIREIEAEKEHEDDI